MKLGTKLLLPLLLATGLVLAIGQTEAWLMDRQGSLLREDDQARAATVQAMGQAQQQLTAAHAVVYRTMVLMASLKEDQVKAAQHKFHGELAAVGKTFAGLAEATDEAEAKQALLAVAPLLERYRKAADEAVDMATVDPNTGIAALQGADARHAELAAALQRVGGRLRADAEAASAAARASVVRLAWLMGGASLLLALGMAVAGWRLQRRLVMDLERASAAARAIAAGDLTHTVQTDRSDEIGDLLGAMATMQQSLQHMVGLVRQASDSIGTASSEIATGNQDLSLRTEQTASNLEQTASAVEQLTSTVRQSADAAAQANQLSHSAQSVAQRGGEVVGQVVATMDAINQSSRKIADIIGTIDGIAFQTNILALNAAVEAARAGEQGRGFAVVAGEVRNLAQRSAEAAREIKSLIGASVERVDSGTRLVREAGSTMGEIVASVQRVTDIIGEITAATSEQSSGFGQVNHAVSNLDQMTQQNAALVEQSAAAAESLKDQARGLAEVVAGFRVGGASAAAPREAWAPVKPARTATPPRAAVPLAGPVASAARAPAGMATAGMATAGKAPAAPSAVASPPAAPTPAAAALPSTASAKSAEGHDDWETF
jgi:methyl-accepting chemotaxis protein